MVYPATASGITDVCCDTIHCNICWNTQYHIVSSLNYIVRPGF
jgi:hypothetical protein